MPPSACALTSPRTIPAGCRRRRCRSCGPLGHESELALDLLANQVLLHLAGHGHGEGVDEADVVRHFVVGDLTLAEIDDLLRNGRSTLAQADDRTDLLAVPRIGDADHRHVEPLWMPIEVLLDLARIHVLAAADDHVLHTAHDVAIAFLV